MQVKQPIDVGFAFGIKRAPLRSRQVFRNARIPRRSIVRSHEETDMEIPLTGLEFHRSEFGFQPQASRSALSTWATSG